MLKTVVETLDGLDEAVKPFYAEAGGKFVLQVDGIDAHPDVANLKSAYERTKSDRAALKADADKAKADLAAALKDKPDEAAVLKLRQELEAERDQWRTKAEEAQGRLTATTRDRQLAEALQAAHVTEPAFIKAATAMLAGAVKMDGDKAIVETDMGPLAVADHVKRWVASEGKAFVTPPAGGGAKGNQGGQAAAKSGGFGGSREERLAAISNMISENG